MKPIARLLMLLGGLPLAAQAAEQDGAPLVFAAVPSHSVPEGRADPSQAAPAPAPASVEVPGGAVNIAADQDDGGIGEVAPVVGVMVLAAASLDQMPDRAPELASAAGRTRAALDAAEPALPVQAAAASPAPLSGQNKKTQVVAQAAVPAGAAPSSAPQMPAPPPEPGILGTPGPAGPLEPDPPPGERLNLKLDYQLDPNRRIEENIPVFVQGQKISGQTGAQTTVEGDAELRKRGSVIKADSITYFPVEDEMLAQQNVRAIKDGSLFTGSELRLKMDAQTGYFLDVDYRLAGDQARGEARRLDFLGQDAYQGEDATYTTCGPDNDDWYLKVGKLSLDFGRNVGEAEDAQIVFMGRKIMQLPSMSFPLNDRRKSGFLSPSIGSSTTSGAEVMVPYYWNIAPNRDLTVTERYMTKRGLQNAGVFRYLGESYKGQLSGELLQNDHQTNTTRYGFSILHTQVFAPGLLGNLDYNKVSDDRYFTDLSAGLALTSQTYLNREGSLSYSTTSGYAFGIRAQSYQTLQDPLNPVTVPYFRLPQLTFNTTQYDVKGFDISAAAEMTRFSSATQVMGTRTVFNPTISYPVITPGYYITPKVGFNASYYNLSNLSSWQVGYSTPGNARENMSVSVPYFSLDSGMTFERQTKVLGNSYTQTLEPRIYYLKVPYRDQSGIPVFDTGLADFNFSQIFSDNRYSGYDRIGDADQITVGASSRLLSSENGSERLRVSLGQRYYFATQQVTLPGEVARTSKSSDFLASFSGEVLTNLRFDSAVEYNPDSKQVQRVSHGVRWSPEPGNTISAAYRYQRDLLEQVDLASQWRLMPRVYGLARYNYSLRDGRVVEAVGGFEYEGDCWVARFVVRRYALASQTASTSIFFQLELNGLSRLGSNPLDILKRNIPGYTKLNDNQAAQPRTFNNYE